MRRLIAYLKENGVSMLVMFIAVAFFVGMNYLGWRDREKGREECSWRGLTYDEKTATCGGPCWRAIEDGGCDLGKIP